MKLKYPKNTPTISIRRNPPALAYCPPRISTHNGVASTSTSAREEPKDAAPQHYAVEQPVVLLVDHRRVECIAERRNHLLSGGRQLGRAGVQAHLHGFGTVAHAKEDGSNDPLMLTDMRDMKNQKLSFKASSISLMVVPVAFKPSRLSRENAHRSAMVSNTIIETG